MALIVYNKENSRPQQVVYQGKRTIGLPVKDNVYRTGDSRWRTG